MNIVIPLALHKRLKAQAKLEGRMLQALVEQILKEGLASRAYVAR